MTTTKSLYLTLLAVLLSPMAANADPIVAGNGDISNLEVGGTDYDVTWNFGSSDPAAGDFALFDGNQTFADAFMDAVLLAFNGSGFSGVAGQVFYGVDYESLTGALVVSDGGSFDRVTGAHGAWSIFPEAGWGSVSASVAVAVPEPSTLALFGIGLIGLGLSRRRKQT